MPIAVRCAECDNEWNERPSMAGRSVECPECKAKNRVSRTAHRPSNKPSNTPRLVLIGSCIFLVGVLGMLAYKLLPILMAEDDSPATPGVVSEPETAGVEVTPHPVAVGTTDPATEDNTIPVLPADTTPPVSTVIDPPMNTEDEIASVINTDRGRELMSEMSDVGIQVTGFSEDVRDTVTDAVRSAVTDAVEKCRVTARAPNAEPIMYVELELKDHHLVMHARLIALDQERPVRVWERSGTVTPLDEKATVTGLLPTNLRRDAETFFKSLRGEFNDARRQFPQ